MYSKYHLSVYSLYLFFPPNQNYRLIEKIATFVLSRIHAVLEIGIYCFANTHSRI